MAQVREQEQLLATPSPTSSSPFPISSGLGEEHIAIASALESRKLLQDELQSAMKVPLRASAVIQEKHIFTSKLTIHARSSHSSHVTLGPPAIEGFAEGKKSVCDDSPPSHAAPPAPSPAAHVCPALSKLVEFPGDLAAIQNMLEHNLPCAVYPAGKDIFGLTAWHKFASWNKTDLLELLLPYLTKDDVNMPGNTFLLPLSLSSTFCVFV